MPSKLTKQIVDWTLYEQFPSHWGAALTVAAVTSRLRNAEKGYRQEYVDMLSELLEGDPHAYAVLSKKYNAIANCEFELLPARVEPEEEENARIVAGFVANSLHGTEGWRTSIAGMLWGDFYGVSAREILWERGVEEWKIVSLELIHSRRIQYDQRFRPYVTNSPALHSGILFDDFPGKFVVFEPSLADEYQTRCGLGRVLAYFMAFKRFGVRDFLGYAERFGKPMPVARWTTSNDGNPRPADEDDIATAYDIVRDIGRGSQPGAAIPDSIELDVFGASDNSMADGIVHPVLIQLCNQEISKAVLGGTLSTDVGDTGGNRALGEVQSVGEWNNIAALARQLDETITHGVIWWLVALNFGEQYANKYLPTYHTIVEQGEDQALAADVLTTLYNVGLKIPVGWVYDRFGIPVPQEDEEVLSTSESDYEQFKLELDTDNEPMDEEPAADDEESGIPDE